MLTYDTIKIKTDNKCLLKKTSTFNKQYNSSTGGEIGQYFSSKDSSRIPFNIFVAENYYQQKLTIEFSSKILLDNYPLMINKNTIRQCLENLEDLGVCKLDVEKVLETSAVTKLDITKDFEFELTDEILDALNSNVNNFRRYKWSHYEREGIVFTSDIKSKKDEIKFYNKYKELTGKSQNKRFLSMLKDQQSVIKYFSNKTRIEVSLNSQNKIKDFLNIDDTYLVSVLNSSANPILREYDEIFDTNKPLLSKEIKSFEDLAMASMLQNYNFDMKSICQAIKGVYSSRSGVDERMKKIKSIKQIMDANKGNNVVKHVRDLLAY